MKRSTRILLAAVVVIALLLAAGYVAGGVVVYNRLSAVRAGCGNFTREDWFANTPSAFVATGTSDEDLTPYDMPDYQDITFPSREDHVTLKGWYMPAQGVAEADAPVVIVVHGLNDCKRSAFVLLPAGMLNKAGFNVLALDMRNHGDSQVINGRYAAGTVEYRDVLGAWDWLVNQKQFAPDKIGLYGMSLGAATVLDAMGAEPRVAATFEDSSFADINVALQAELQRNNFPTLLSAAGVLMGRIIGGVDITTRSPLAAVGTLNGRDLFITHGAADQRLSVQYAYDLANAAKAQGWTGEPWIAEGSQHVKAMWDHTAEYEAMLVGFFTTSLKQ
jgi:dipeptidyl aminopeptidase/acylaminoacyl peptidase